MAVKQDQLRQRWERAANLVPEENRIIPHPAVLGPILEGIKYHIDDNPVTEMFEALLSRSMDRVRVFEAHPTFIQILNRLSPDECRLLRHLDGGVIESETGVDYMLRGVGDPMFPPRKRMIIPEYLNISDDALELYYSNMQSLGLVIYESSSEMDLGGSKIYKTALKMMPLGRSLMKACASPS